MAIKPVDYPRNVTDEEAKTLAEALSKYSGTTVRENVQSLRKATVATLDSAEVFIVVWPDTTETISFYILAPTGLIEFDINKADQEKPLSLADAELIRCFGGIELEEMGYGDLVGREVVKKVVIRKK